MADGSVNREAAFLNFNAEFEKNRLVFSLFLFSFAESNGFEKAL